MMNYVNNIWTKSYCYLLLQLVRKPDWIKQIKEILTNNSLYDDQNCLSNMSNIPDLYESSADTNTYTYTCVNLVSSEGIDNWITYLHTIWQVVYWDKFLSSSKNINK